MQKQPQSDSAITPIVWQGDRLELLDQRLLPHSEQYVTARTSDEVAQAIHQMVVRGAPAIGIAAAYGVVLAASAVDGDNWRADLTAALQRLAASRPTAVNLRWALDRMGVMVKGMQRPDAGRLLAEAQAIHAEDLAQNRRMGDLGAALFGSPVQVLTHCNTGALATGGYGTALGVIRSAHRDGRLLHVYADETRPWLQGSRLTAWELAKEGIPAQLIADGAAAYLMAQRKVDWVIVGADRVTANGDVVNKIGTYSLAVAARHHGVRFMVVAPSSTVDMHLASGAGVPIEERPASELTQLRGLSIAPQDFPALNPVFDVTPAHLVDVLVTERGVLQQPDVPGMKALMGG
jgi:methylthioribose-1-phosphate isomerase